MRHTPPLPIRLREVYGLEFADFVALEAGGPVTHQALRDGHVDVALLFSTDPELVAYVELTDDRHLQPAENVTPLVRTEILDRWGGEVGPVINVVSHESTPTRCANSTTPTRRRPALTTSPRSPPAGCKPRGLRDHKRTSPVRTELGGHGAVTYVPPSARWGRRRRRPTGAPPPLPRAIGTTGKVWLACSVLLIAWMVVTVHSAWARRVTDRVDAAISRAFARAAPAG